MVPGMQTRDVCIAAYLFEYFAGQDRRARPLYDALVGRYAEMFAEWLGYVFLNRANLTQASKAMKALEADLSTWVESIADMVAGPYKKISEVISADAARFVDLDMLDRIGVRIVQEVRKDFGSAGKQARVLDELPISYNREMKRYEIPKSQLTYTNRNLLKDLGFRFVGDVWVTEVLDSHVLEVLPQAAKLGKATPAKAPHPDVDPRTWYFDVWLPRNITRFSKIFNDYSRKSGVKYEFTFAVSGSNADVAFRRNIKTVADAVAEIRARYGGASDRDVWIQAVDAWEMLRRSPTMKSIDRANDLEHTHGSMIEHFPQGVQSWYPAFLDFKYSASLVKMTSELYDEDLRFVAEYFLPANFRETRLKDSLNPTEHRTDRGLAMEVMAQRGKAAKKKHLKEVQKLHPELYDKVVLILEGKGLDLV